MSIVYPEVAKNDFDAMQKMREHNAHFRARGYKINFMLNSSEHEILNAHITTEISRILALFSGSDKPRVHFCCTYMLKCRQQLSAF